MKKKIFIGAKRFVRKCSSSRALIESFELIFEKKIFKEIFQFENDETELQKISINLYFLVFTSWRNLRVCQLLADSFRSSSSIFCLFSKAFVLQSANPSSSFAAFASTWRMQDYSFWSWMDLLLLASNENPSFCSDGHFYVSARRPLLYHLHAFELEWGFQAKAHSTKFFHNQRVVELFELSRAQEVRPVEMAWINLKKSKFNLFYLTHRFVSFLDFGNQLKIQPVCNIKFIEGSIIVIDVIDQVFLLRVVRIGWKIF